MNVLQNWLISQRYQQGLSQLQLAERLSKSVRYIEQVEEGEYVLEIIEYLHYCKALNVDPNVGITLIEIALSKN